MTDTIQLYIFIGVIVAMWCFSWSWSGDSKIPLSSYLLIVLIWPYQVYLQIKRGDK